MQAVIMAGGSGVRLRPFTYAIPKPLLPLGEISILEFIVKTLKRTGITEIFLVTSHQHNKFAKCLDYENKYGLKIHLCFEGEQKGTAGGIILLKDQLVDDFLILNGDVLVRTDFESMFNHHKDSNADITIGVTTFDFTVPHGVIVQGRNDELVSIVEKPKHSFLINAGMYILNPSVFDLMGNLSYLDMPELVTFAKAANKKVLTYHIGDRWLDTGQLSDYENAVEKIAQWTTQIDKE